MALRWTTEITLLKRDGYIYSQIKDASVSYGWQKSLIVLEVCEAFWTVCDALETSQPDLKALTHSQGERHVLTPEVPIVPLYLCLAWKVHLCQGRLLVGFDLQSARRWQLSGLFSLGTQSRWRLLHWRHQSAMSKLCCISTATVV